jgi:hypothetical protein
MSLVTARDNGTLGITQRTTQPDSLSSKFTIRERLTALETSTRPMLEERHEQQSENRQGWKSFMWHLAASATVGAVTALGIVKSSGG